MAGGVAVLYFDVLAQHWVLLYFFLFCFAPFLFFLFSFMAERTEWSPPPLLLLLLLLLLLFAVASFFFFLGHSFTDGNKANKSTPFASFFLLAFFI